MTHIIFYPNWGGVGDAVVGCSSAFILSLILDAKLKITDGNIHFFDYFDIPDKYSLKDENQLKIDDIYRYRPCKESDDFFLNNKLNIFKNKNIVIKTGSNFSRFLYKNKNFKHKINIPETDVIYHLFKNILIPKSKYLNRLNKFINKYDVHNSVCMQIRTFQFKEFLDLKNPLNVSKTIERFINCFKSLKHNNKIVLTTDNYEMVKNLLEKNNIKDIIFIDGKITHSRKSEKVDNEKTLLDMLIIGECKHAIISYWSNFGRIGCLRTRHKSVWLVEPDFKKHTQELKKQFRDKNDPLVNNFRQGGLSELLSKESSNI
tara:strand:- start:524 stop:1474 length:951 start_codon:yes stop_codon:yes gene_type:complete